MSAVFKNSFVIIIVVLVNACVKLKNPFPVITTSGVSEITLTTAVSGGKLDHPSESIITKGICWSTNPFPTIDDKSVADHTIKLFFSIKMTHLLPNTVYYVRSFVSTDIGTGYGNQVSFTTLESYTGETGTVTDIDGNVYSTIGIGTQIWMKENLRTVYFNDYNYIPVQWYNSGSQTYIKDFGVLYNGWAVEHDKLCPTGWHIPSNAEWNTLTDYLGGLSAAGNKLKEKGTSHWNSPNDGATNESQFSALPGGFNNNDGETIENIGNVGWWWTSSKDNGAWVYFWARTISNSSNADVKVYSMNQNYGFSVRCIKDG